MDVRKATAINASGKYLKMILTVLINAVLARLLTPFDFGIVAVLTVFTTFFSTLSDMGLGAAIVQKKELNRNDINSLFTYSIYVSAGLCVIFALCAFPIAAFYKDAIYLKPTFLLTISLFFNAANMVPNGILNRNKKFVTIAIRTVVVYLVSALAAIWLALHGWRFYALIAQTIIASFLQFVWNWASTKPLFILHPDKSSIAKVKSYSFFQFAFNIVNYFSRNLDNLLAGKFMGEINLGNYNKAYNLMLFPVNNLSGVISPVLHPILSDLQNDKAAIYSRFTRLVRFLFCLGIYISAFAYLASEEIISILYGDQWAMCVRCFQLLAIAIIPQMINASAGAIFQSIGNTKLLFYSTCINTAVTITAILTGIFAGATIESLALCVSISYLFHFFCAFYFLIVKGFGYSFHAFLAVLRKEFAILLVVIASVAAYCGFLSPTFDNLISGNTLICSALSLIIKAAYLFVFFAVMMYITREYKLFTKT